MDQPTQDAIFLAVAKKYADGPLFIKTHPRDETDYHKLFPQAVVLERTMPSEVLNFCLPGKFKRARDRAELGAARLYRRGGKRVCRAGRSEKAGEK